MLCEFSAWDLRGTSVTQHKSQLQGYVVEKKGDGLAVVRAADGLGQDRRNVNGLDLGALGLLLLMRARVGHLRMQMSTTHDSTLMGRTTMASILEALSLSTALPEKIAARMEVRLTIEMENHAIKPCVTNAYTLVAPASSSLSIT